MTVTYTVGDTREVIKGIPDGSVDLIASSPPFLALRSYVPSDHESKGDEIGSERNPAEFIDMLLGLTAEWGRVLAPHGSLAIELGDTYSGSGGGGGDYLPGGLRENQPGFGGSAQRQRDGNAAHWRAKNVTPDAWPRAKSLALIPQLYATSLAYGRNILRSGVSARQLLDFIDRLIVDGVPAADAVTMAREWLPQVEAIQSPSFQPWLVRNVIVWHRPNPAVGALGDKVRPSTSYIVVATRSPKRWFDLTAVRTAQDPATGRSPGVVNGGWGGVPRGRLSNGDGLHGGEPHGGSNPAGAPPLDAWFDEYDGTHDTWTLTTQPSRISVKVPTLVPCGPDDGGERTTSPDCPVHGDQADQVPTAPDGEPATEPSPHTSRTGDHRGLVPQRSDACDAETSSCSHRTRSSATPCDKESSRTDLDQSTSVPGTPSAQTAADTPHTPESPESSGDHLGTSASSSDEVCPRAGELEMAPRSDYTPCLESACTCTFHLDKYSVHSHYAMWPAKLAERLVLSMCPREVCRVCNQPRRRMERPGVQYLAEKAKRTRANDGFRPQLNGKTITADLQTLGWSECGCVCPTCGGRSVVDDPTNCWHDKPCPDCTNGRPSRPGLVLDPFCGSGTSLAVADLHGRDAIGVDFDARNKAIYPARYDEVKRALYGTPAPMPGQEAFDFAI